MTSSYTGSGFDRNYKSSSADRTSTVVDNSATFLMANMMPQADAIQMAWAKLEDYCRTLLVSIMSSIFICGGYGHGGTGSNSNATTLNKGRVIIPAHC
jgi:endonuclease G